MENLENSENPQELYAKAVELASLIGTYLWKTNYKELLKSDFKNKFALRKGLKQLQENNANEITVVFDGEEHTMNESQVKAKLEEVSDKMYSTLNDFHGLIQVDSALKSETESNGLDEMNLETLLDEDFTYDVIDRIRELYAQDKVRSYYESELTNRKDSFTLLKNGYTHLHEVNKLDAIIEQAKDKILDIRIKAFEERRQVNPQEMALINKIKEHIALKLEGKEKLLAYKEIGTVYRLEELRKYRRQFETSGYIKTPSLEKLIEKTIDYVLLGKNVLLTGPTGTGKTVLAVEAVKVIAKKMNIQVAEISGKKLGEELAEGKTLKELDEFVEVLSGHAGVTPSEFISKVRLQTDGKGGTETVSELGKVLRAFVNGSIPIIDEIDLIPNDVLMRIKHLFTLKVGQSYAPQEDENNRHTLISTSVIATANIKSDKHPDREDLDPAIIRLFKGVEIGYLPSHEIYDIAITSIIQKEGFIYGTGTESLTDNQQGILYLLVAALKDIESNYLGIGEGESILNKSKQFLRKAVLELGNFIGLFVGFKESGKEFNNFIKEQILEFASNHAYPKNDRLILIKIFSSKGLILKSDIALLTDMMSDIGEEELDQSIISNSFEFEKDTINFVDPYQLANMDPYKKRNLDELELKYKPSEIVEFVKELDSYLMNGDISDTEKLEDFIQNFFDQVEKDINYDLDTKEKQQALLALLYEKELSEWILKLEEEYPVFQDNIKILKILDMTKGKKLFGDLTKKEEESAITVYMKEIKGKIEKIIDENKDDSDDKVEEFHAFIKNFFDHKELDNNYDLVENGQQQSLLGLLYELEMKDWILKLEEECPLFEDNIKKLKMLDVSKGKKLFVEIEESEETKWTSDFEFFDLLEDMKIKKGSEKGSISWVDDNKKEIGIVRENGNEGTYSFEEFKKTFEIPLEK